MKGAGAVDVVDFVFLFFFSAAGSISISVMSPYVSALRLRGVCESSGETPATLPQQLMQHEDTLLFFSFRVAASPNWRNSSWTI